MGKTISVLNSSVLNQNRPQQFQCSTPRLTSETAPTRIKRLTPKNIEHQFCLNCCLVAAWPALHDRSSLGTASQWRLTRDRGLKTVAFTQMLALYGVTHPRPGSRCGYARDRDPLTSLLSRSLCLTPEARSRLPTTTTCLSHNRLILCLSARLARILRTTCRFGRRDVCWASACPRKCKRCSPCWDHGARTQKVQRPDLFLGADCQLKTLVQDSLSFRLTSRGSAPNFSVRSTFHACCFLRASALATAGSSKSSYSCCSCSEGNCMSSGPCSSTGSSCSRETKTKVR